jgi:GrpB-like predicted nucleotidyltransferase (UPF0157 family)
MIGPYRESPVTCCDNDPRAAEVARRVGALIVERLPDVTVAHVGSTAVPGCAGKGVVDLMLLYPAGRLAAARDALDALGFQRQSTRDPFPEERPMRVGAIEHDGKTFLLHVHVIATDSAEADELRTFRDRLRADEALKRAYVAAKRAIIDGGTTDSVAYCMQKGSFVRRALDLPPAT